MHLNVPPSATGTSVNDVGAPEDGNVLHLIPKRRRFAKNLGYDESCNVIARASDEPETHSGEESKKLNVKYASRLAFETENSSLHGATYITGKEMPKPYRVGKKPFNKYDYMHSNGTGVPEDNTRFLKRHNITIPEDAAGLKSERLKRDPEEAYRKFPEKWWQMKDERHLVHTLAQHQRWFNSPILDESDSQHATKQTKNKKEIENERSLKHKKESIQRLAREEVKDTGRGTGAYTYKLRHARHNPIYHVQHMPGFKPGIHTTNEPNNPNAERDVMRTYPAELMQAHHLKPTVGMLAWET